MFWNFFTSSHQRALRPSQAGFGLIELMVSISIMIIVVSIVLASQASFNSAILLRSQTFDIALDVREVQLSAVSAIGVGGKFREKLGVWFDTTSPNSYLLYRDLNGDGNFDVGSEEYASIAIDPRFEIIDITAGGGSETQVMVVFERPNFDANFFDDESLGSEYSGSSVEIHIGRIGASGTGCGEVRKVEITSTGQISVVDC